MCAMPASSTIQVMSLSSSSGAPCATAGKAFTSPATKEGHPCSNCLQSASPSLTTTAMSPAPVCRLGGDQDASATKILIWNAGCCAATIASKRPSMFLAATLSASSKKPSLWLALPHLHSKASSIWDDTDLCSKTLEPKPGCVPTSCIPDEHHGMPLTMCAAGSPISEQSLLQARHPWPIHLLGVPLWAVSPRDAYRAFR